MVFFVAFFMSILSVTTYASPETRLILKPDACQISFLRNPFTHLLFDFSLDEEIPASQRISRADGFRHFFEIWLKHREKYGSKIQLEDPRLLFLHSVSSNLYVSPISRKWRANEKAKEIESSQRYARFIAMTDETLFLFPHSKTLAVPALDGVVFGSDGRAVANYSLKVISTGTRIRYAQIMKEIANYTINERRWLDLLLLKRDQVFFRNEKAWKKYQEKISEIVFMLELFGIPPHTVPKECPRKTRLVVDLTHSQMELPQEKGLNILKRFFNYSLFLDSVVLMKDSEALVFSKFGIRQFHIE